MERQGSRSLDNNRTPAVDAAMHVALALILVALLCLLPTTASAGEASASVTLDTSSGIRGAPPTISPPLPGHPVRFISIPGGDVYAQMPNGTIRSIRSGRTVVTASDLATDGYRFAGMSCGSTLGPRFACLVRLLKTESSGSQSVTYQKLVLLDSDSDRSETLASGSREGYSVAGLGIHVSGDGDPTYAWAETVPTGNNSTTPLGATRRG